jgi:hypothetical protein
VGSDELGHSELAIPHDYVRKQRLYRDNNGNLITRRELKALIDNLTATVQKDAAKIASAFDAGELSASAFADAMSELLTSAHIVAASVGKGGRELMTAADWGKVGAKIKWQNGYLEKFAKKLATGTLSKANTLNRARSYVNSVYISYAKTFLESQAEVLQPETDKVITDENMLCRLVQNSEEGCEECSADADEGWMPVSEMGELGSRICGDYCKCEIEFEDEL